MEVVLEHYKQIDIIRQAERQVETNFKIKPYDISHWNSGEEYKKLLLSALELPPLSNLSDYCYSYSYSNKVKTRILSQHSFINAACTIFNSATAAIATICCALKEQGSVTYKNNIKSHWIIRYKIPFCIKRSCSYVINCKAIFCY